MESWHLPEIGAVLLAEFIFNKFKTISMKETIIKISVHIFVGIFLNKLGHMINQFGEQAIHPDRCLSLEF